MKKLFTLGFIFIVFASQAVWVTFSPVLTYVAEELKTPVEMLGLLAVTYPMFFSVLTIPSGLLLDKNFKRWFIFGSFMTFLAATGRFLSSNYYWLLTCQLFGAIGQPFLLNAFVPYASQHYPERRTIVISILSLSMYLGTIFALAMGYRLYTAGGLHLLFLPSALIGGIGMLLISISFPRMHFIKSENPTTIRLRNVIRRRDLWILGMILGFGVATFDNLATWLQPALRCIGLEKMAGDAVALAIILGLVGTALIPSQITKRNLRTLYMRTVTPLIALFFVTLAFVANEILIFALLGIGGLLMLPAYAIVMDWIGKFCTKEMQGSASGFVGLISRIVAITLTLNAIYFIDTVYLYFTYLTIPLTIAFILTLLLPNDSKPLKITIS